ncbi:hypothetical protein [Helicobacter mustelae]|uniref:hypothetical protein n=1 Tax=Helicobacter mustelae TaxID=217 RepID=UPI000E0E3C12|nr:hypothetical protein [Helicobacter mustelae]
MTLTAPAAQNTQTAEVKGSGGNATFTFTNGAGSLMQDGTAVTPAQAQRGKCNHSESKSSNSSKSNCASYK